MNYYRSNALYEALLDSEWKCNFRWAAGNSWVLLYGDRTSKPLTVAFVEGTSALERNRKLVPLAIQVAEGLKVPTIGIRFNDSVSQVQTVGYCDTLGSEIYEEISLEELQIAFAKFGFPTTRSSVVKAINDRSSSAYHQWQRRALGGQIVVSDVDLFRIQNDSIIEVMELKRSYYSLLQWNPFGQDYPNFELVYNATKNKNIAFHIVYNRREKNPFYDDASRLALFSFDPTSRPQSLRIGEFEFEDFAAGTYLD